MSAPSSAIPSWPRRTGGSPIWDPRASQRNTSATTAEPAFIASPAAAALRGRGHVFTSTPEIGAATARQVFAERGVEAPLDEIARRAGLGIATLYRHFRTREALVEAIFAERVGEFLAGGEAALAETDAWAGLVGFLEATLELQSSDRVLKEIFLRYPPGEGSLAEARQQMRQLFKQVLARAHEQGVLRPDFGLPDLAMLLWSFAPVIDATAETAPHAWRCHLHWVLDGLRTQAATPQSEPPLNDEQLTEAMRRLREHRFQRKPGPPRRRDGES
jgi:AcrR family transcriptional regulator